MKKPKRSTFDIGERVFYRAHGSGIIRNVSHESFAGFEIQSYTFELDTGGVIKVPVDKAIQNGMRPASSEETLAQIIKTLTGNSRPSKLNYGRRLYECIWRINTGDPVQIASVIRDLYHKNGFTEAQYAPKLINDCAFTLLLPEVAAIITDSEAEAFRMLVNETGKTFVYSAVVLPTEIRWLIDTMHYGAAGHGYSQSKRSRKRNTATKVETAA